MEEELFDGMVARMNASTLRKADETYARSSSNKTSLANLDLTDSCTRSRVGLTDDEVEEAAFLLLAKEAKIKSERDEVKSDVSRTLIDSVAQFETVTSSEEEIVSMTRIQSVNQFPKGPKPTDLRLLVVLQCGGSRSS